jgi:hypothetical protein
MKKTRMIEAYLDGTLNDEERLALEKQADEDRDLRELIRVHREVNESIRDKELHNLKASLDAVGSAFFEGSKLPHEAAFPRIIRILAHNRLMRIASSVLLIVALAITAWQVFFAPVSTGRLYREYYAPYETDFVSRSVQLENNQLNNALVLYGQGNYTGALALLEGVSLSGEAANLASFYRGLVYLETGETAKAVLNFNLIPDPWNSTYHVHRNWYLALALLKAGDKPAALEKLNDLMNPGGFYSERATRMVRKLNP